jgi:hypothetical protein
MFKKRKMKNQRGCDKDEMKKLKTLLSSQKWHPSTLLQRMTE